MAVTGPILVVDDEPMVRKLLSEALQRHGSEVVTAGDGEEALAMFREIKSPLVFTDLKMPKMDGRELIRSLKSIAPDTSVVVVTGYADSATMEEVLEEGAAHVLAKPFTLAELKAALNKVARKAIPPPPPLPVETTPVLTQHPRMEAALALARRVAKTDATILVQGETGTGKEVLSRFIHAESARAQKPFVAVNCSALPESLIEAELFGHERGAFTGATNRRTGRFEAASGGTLLLDEITEIPQSVQVKLLRALQERQIERVGSNEVVRVDVRVIAVTNRDLRKEVREGRFRQDLFFRLNVITLNLPPLRERPTDIVLLSRHFLTRYAAAHGSKAEGFTPGALECLTSHSWPGNVRELENAIQRAVILCQDTLVGAEHVLLEDSLVEPVAPSGATVADMERQLIMATLERLDGNRTHAAKALGVSVRTIRNRLREYRMSS
jgi:DNA-binding NtrC family response regulator